ncbi:MAG TPA: Gldg family protein [Candidatus Methylomirabilis sp.]|nr:Gldg family protein [Candidatus Methylomirabilis sp.]
MNGDLGNVVWFVVVMAALLVLFAAGVRLPVARAGWPRRVARSGVVAGAVLLVLLANIALYRHDLHIDVTRSQAFTPSPEARRVITGLTTDVELTYFYQKQNPAGRAAKRMVEVMGRTSPRLHVRTVDPDQQPGLASRYGVRVYNVAVLEAEGRRVEVVTTEDRDMALGILRLVRGAEKTICFAAGHGEYDINNMEYHTHFEGVHSHSHDAEGIGVVLMEQHGVGRLRRALETLGFATRKIILATAGRVPDDCAALVEANPRTLYAPPEARALEDYLRRGGAALLMYDIEFPVEPSLAALLATAGLRLSDGVVIDPLDHYFTDPQMVAVTRYTAHPITRGLALTFYPGVRPLEPLGAPGVTVTPLFSSSPESYVRPLRDAGAKGAAPGPQGPQVLAVAVEGRWPGAPPETPFRLVVVGDGDFASNSFFPYMSNSDFVLAALAWLLREERAPTMKPPVEVLPTVVLTNRQVREIFAFTVFVLPGLAVLIGGAVWWRRRR